MSVSKLSVSSLSVSLALAVASAGCNLVKMPGLSKGGSTTPGGSSSSAESSGGSGGGDAASVATAYSKFTFESCRDFDCVTRFKKAANVTTVNDSRGYMVQYNPRADKNPDPAWLPGWDQLPTKTAANDADVVYEALASAAIAKTWQAKCNSTYAAVHQRLTAADEKMTAAIAAALAKPGVSDRLAALVALRDNALPRDLGYEARLEKLVGGRYALEVAILDAYRAADREYAYFVVPGTEAAEAVVQYGRPRGKLAEERTNYCAQALAGHIKAVPKPDAWGTTYLAHGQVAVTPPVDAMAVEKITAGHKAVAADNANRFKATRDYAALGSTVNEGSAGKALAHIITETKVTSSTRNGSKLVVELANVHHNTVPYGCKQTNQLDSAGNWALDCKLRDVYSDQHTVITFDDVPEDISLQAGDRLELFGKVTSAKEKTLVNSAALTKLKEDFTITGAHFVRAVR